MPHAWVASDFIRSALDLLRLRARADDAIVIGAGWTDAWRASGIELSGLQTAWGRLDYRLAPTPQGWLLDLPRALSGGRLRLVWPGRGPLPKASHRGLPLAWDGRELALPAAPATVLLGRPAPAHPDPDKP